MIEWEEELTPKARRKLIHFAHQAAGAHSKNPAPWLTLAKLLRLDDLSQEARQTLVGAVERIPDNVALRLALAKAHADANDVDLALREAEAARQIDASDGRVALTLFSLFCRSERWAEAAYLENDVARTSPAAPALLEFAWHGANEQAGLKALVKRCDAVLVANPATLDAVYRKALALARLGKDQEASSLIATDEVIAIRDLPVPPGFASTKKFGQALKREILADRSLAPDPRNRATRGGRQTRQLHASPRFAYFVITGRNSIGS